MADGTDNLQLFEDWAAGLLDKVSPAQRRKLASDIGNKLRRSQMARIKAQQAPDGSAYDARKKPKLKRNFRGKKGGIKRNAMFSKLSTARFMKMQVTPEGVAVGFFGRIAKIARVHQEGMSDIVKPSGRPYQYPSRILLGFSKADRDMIGDELIKHLSL